MNINNYIYISPVLIAKMNDNKEEKEMCNY